MDVRRSDGPIRYSAGQFGVGGEAERQEHGRDNSKHSPAHQTALQQCTAAYEASAAAAHAPNSPTGKTRMRAMHAAAEAKKAVHREGAEVTFNPTCVRLASRLSPSRSPSSRPLPLSVNRHLPASALTAGTYVPVTGVQRVDWIVDGTVGRRSLVLVGPLATAWQTAFNYA